MLIKSGWGFTLRLCVDPLQMPVFPSKPYTFTYEVPAPHKEPTMTITPEQLAAEQFARDIQQADDIDQAQRRGDFAEAARLADELDARTLWQALGPVTLADIIGV